MIAMAKHEDHARNQAPMLARCARAVFVTARAVADADGMVPDRYSLAPVVGLSRVRLRFWFGHLEQRRFAGRALVKRQGSSGLWVLLADIPGVPPRPRSETSTDKMGRRTGNFEWRRIRAQLGGLQRATNEAIERRRVAEAELEKIGSKLYEEHTAESRLGVNVEVAAYRADLEHAIGCSLAVCPRCEEIVERLGIDRARYVKAADVSATLERHEQLVVAVGEMFAAQRDKGLGAAGRRVNAWQRVARLLEG